MFEVLLSHAFVVCFDLCLRKLRKRVLKATDFLEGAVTIVYKAQIIVQ